MSLGDVASSGPSADHWTVLKYPFRHYMEAENAHIVCLTETRASPNKLPFDQDPAWDFLKALYPVSCLSCRIRLCRAQRGPRCVSAEGSSADHPLSPQYRYWRGKMAMLSKYKPSHVTYGFPNGTRYDAAEASERESDLGAHCPR